MKQHPASHTFMYSHINLLFASVCVCVWCALVWKCHHFFGAFHKCRANKHALPVVGCDFVPESKWGRKTDKTTAVSGADQSAQGRCGATAQCEPTRSSFLFELLGRLADYWYAVSFLGCCCSCFWRRHWHCSGSIGILLELLKRFYARSQWSVKRIREGFINNKRELNRMNWNEMNCTEMEEKPKWNTKK